MQRGNLVEGLVETHEHVEECTESAAGVGPIEGKAVGERHEARHRDHLRGQQPSGVRVALVPGGGVALFLQGELPLLQAQVIRQAEPFEREDEHPVDGCLDGAFAVRILHQFLEPCASMAQVKGLLLVDLGECALPRKRLTCPGGGLHAATRRASETVKIPHSSMR